MSIPLRVLLLEDQPDDAELLVVTLRRAGFDPDWRRVDSRADYEASLGPGLDVVLADYSLPQFTALQALELLQARELDIPFIVVTGSFEYMAIDCMKRGAADYLIKDRLGRLGLAVEQALQDRRVRAEAREARERAAQLDRMAAVGQFVAGIAPNFSQILSAIILHSEMVLGSFELSRRDEDRIRTVLKHAERGAFLTRQILDFGRQSEMEPLPLTAGQFMRQLKTTLSSGLPEAIQLAVEVRDESCMVNADPGRLQQAFMNLVQNAVEAMPKGGELRLEMDSFQLDPIDTPPMPELVPGQWVRMRVVDAGRGIDEQHLPHVFEPFFTTKGEVDGAGLGLAQAYGIVKQHGGHIEVRSTKAKGSEFTIYLPAAGEAAQLAPVPVRPSRTLGAGRMILVVDDDKPTREAVSEMLGSLNYQTVLAQDGDEALQIMQNPPQRIDLVLTDLVMPKIGGLELLERLRALKLAVPMVLMTSYPLGPESDELAGSGLVGWLEKPLTEGSLARTMRSILK